MIIEYETLKLIWLFVIGILIIGFAITGGWDLGAGFLLPVIGKTDDERQSIIDSIGPTWEGNQVWLITAAASFFAVWPIFYATVFSTVYFAILLLLFALILRPPGIDYRSKLKNTRWRSFWDSCLFLNGLLCLALFGILFANLLLGLPYQFDENLRSSFSVNYLSLFSPYALLGAVVSLSALGLQGSNYLLLKTNPPIQDRSQQAAKLFGAILFVSFIAIFIWTLYGVKGYQIRSIPPLGDSFMPTLKQVNQEIGLWQTNYQQQPLGYALPILVAISTLLSVIFASNKQPIKALFFSSSTLIFLIATFGFTCFPFILCSSVSPNHSLTIWDACSSYRTLSWMLAGVIIFLPIVLAYTLWVFYVMRSPLSRTTSEDKPTETGHLY